MVANVYKANPKAMIACQRTEFKLHGSRGRFVLGFLTRKNIFSVHLVFESNDTKNVMNISANFSMDE